MHAARSGERRGRAPAAAQHRGRRAHEHGPGRQTGTGRGPECDSAIEQYAALRVSASLRENCPSGGRQSCSMLDEQLAQYRAMAPRLIFAVAAHRKVRVVRKRGEQLDGTTRIG